MPLSMQKKKALETSGESFALTSDVIARID
jgi:hypothetical protein